MNHIWTTRATSEYEKILFFLLERWTVKEAQKFVENVSSVLTEIENNPSMFKASKTHPYMRKAKISKHNSLIYEVEPDSITLLRFIDHRSNQLH